MSKNLPFDCSCTDMWVRPSNWKTLNSKKSLDQEWYVQSKFYDPPLEDKYPNGFQFRKRLNKFSTLDQRKAAVEFYLKQLSLLLEKRYNLFEVKVLYCF